MKPTGPYKDLSSNKFGKLLALDITKHDGGQIKRSSDGHILWRCKCECGVIVEKRSSSLISGNVKSCGKCRNDITGQKFGKLTALEPVKDENGNNAVTTQGSVVWRCICECGAIKEVGNGQLKSSKSITCGNCRYKDIAGKQFGKLVALEPKRDENNIIIRDNWKSVVWKCQCKCGEITYVTSGHLCAGDTKSCGCITCSKNISQNILSDKIKGIFAGYEVIQNYRKLEWLYNPKTKCNLEIDIYLPELKVAIEYDGEQHFKPMRFRSRKEMIEKLDRTQKLDKAKDRLVRKHIKNNGQDIKYFVRFGYKEPLTKKHIVNKLIKAGIEVL